MEKDIQDRVRSKYRVSIAELKALNFEELCFFRETVRGFGLANGLTGPLSVLAALPKEVAKIGKDLSVSLFMPLLVSREYDTYVAPFGLGTKFYTSFRDGTCLITANFASQAITDDEAKLYKFAQPCSIAAAWKYHRTQVDKLTASGKQRNYHLSFDNFVELTSREDCYMLKANSITSSTSREIGSGTISAIIFWSLLVAAIFIFMAPMNLAHILYPACWFVRSMGKPSLLQSLPIVLACLALSWSLARIQKRMYLVDGAGTMLRGQTPLPNAQGYISTKWLVFVLLPILPVRSYQIVGEVSKIGTQKPPSMQPLAQLHWAQIRETLWQFKWWYLLVALLWIGMGVWAFSQCM
jgi:hypothetical protein